MTGEVKIERDCVKVSHRTFLAIVFGVVTITAAAVWYFARLEAADVEARNMLYSIDQKLERYNDKHSLILRLCCPQFYGKILGMTEQTNTNQ
jgi:hypothetical protein